jgi:hypothetical protein
MVKELAEGDEVIEWLTSLLGIGEFRPGTDGRMTTGLHARP